MPYKKTFLLFLLAVVFVLFNINSLLSGALKSSSNNTLNELVQYTPKTTVEVTHPHNINEDNTFIYSNKIQTTRECFAPLLPQNATKQAGHFYQLKTNLNQESKGFIKELNQKLYLIFNDIEASFNIQLTRAVNLNLIYLPSQEIYENYLMGLGRSVTGSIGVYLYPEHISVIQSTNAKQVMISSLHESIHAFNQSYWGKTLRFFNEGMAEYYENISMDAKFEAFDFSGLTDQSLPLAIDVLLFSETDWHGANKSRLYHNSNALFHFLMSTQQGRTVIWVIMKLEAKDSCSTLSEHQVLNVLFELYPNHQQEFDYWFKEGLFNFLQKVNH